MKDINKEEFSEFEEAWQRAFEQAEMPVEPDVWNNIDGHLANKDADKYKRKIVFYKWVAAASIVFAISLSYFNYYYNVTQPSLAVTDYAPIQNDEPSTRPLDLAELNANKENKYTESDKINNTNTQSNGLAMQRDIQRENDALAHNNTESEAETEPLKTTSPSSELGLTQEKAGTASAEAGNERLDMPQHHEQTQMLAGLPGVEGEASRAVLVVDESERNVVASAARELHDGDLVAMHQAGQPYYMEHYAQLLDPPYIYAIPGIRPIAKEKDKAEPKIMWAGLNVGSGIFDPNFENGSNYQPSTSPALSQTYASARESPQAASFQESTSAGVTYSLGLNFGMRLNEKWVLQSGVQYAYKSASTNSTTYLRTNYDEKIKPTLKNNMSTEAVNFSNASFTQEYDLLNSFEFATIPVKAGYLLVDRKVGLMLTAGVGADIFLSNTISENNDRLDDVKMSSGSESPFRDVNFNGLVGAELFYQISKQYHLTLEPNYSIALSPLTKSHSGFRSNPQTFGVTAGLKYYWK